jgi:hypothetical protein
MRMLFPTTPVMFSGLITPQNRATLKTNQSNISEFNGDVTAGVRSRRGVSLTGSGSISIRCKGEAFGKQTWEKTDNLSSECFAPT